MPLITEQTEIRQLVCDLQERNVSLYHACQYNDFLSYIELGGIPSRCLMQTQHMTYTPFETDQQDQTNGVWDRVFANMDDFGRIYLNASLANQSKPPSTPNPYGPILLIVNPEVLLTCQDVCISLRSAGGKGFRINSESLNYNDVKKLFQNEDLLNNSSDKYFKKLADLKTIFDLSHKASFPEINCKQQDQLFKMEYIRKIQIENYQINNNPLINYLPETHKNLYHTRETNLNQFPKNQIIQSLINKYIETELTPKSEDFENGNVKSWLNSFKDHPLNYTRFINYLIQGTLKPLKDIST